MTDLLVMPVSINVCHLNHLCNQIKSTSFEFKVEIQGIMPKPK